MFAHSYYSLRYGTISPADLVKKASELGIETLALIDIHRVSGVYEFVQQCKNYGIKPVVGMEFRKGDTQKYICLAKNSAGFSAINAFASTYLMQELPFPERPPQWEDVYTIYPFSERNKLNLGPNEYVGIHANDLKSLWKESDFSKFIWCHPATFLNKQGYSMHRLLRAIDHNCLLSKLPEDAQADKREYLWSPKETESFLKDYPSILESTKTLLASCSFEVDFKSSKNKKQIGKSRKEDHEKLTHLALEGLKYRYDQDDPIALKRVQKELKVIHDLHFDAYFLITWDIIQFARSKGYFHVGRGSGANSIVAYCLGITDVDPIELDLYFERFINPHRTSPPDFDIDFSWDERNEIIAYIFEKYGAEHVCLLATYVTFRDKSIYRELAKVFGLPKTEIDAWLEPDSLIRKEGGDELHRLIVKYGQLLLDFPNYLSIHAGGVLISEEPLSHYTALEAVPKGFPICQFDMYIAEELGFAKFDILSQRGLGHIKEAVEIIKENRGIEIDIHRVQDFMKDEGVKAQMERHETMGCFYIESPAMRQLIKKLNCNNYLTLVAASSIIRPGVASSGMMKAYIDRHHNPDSYEATHPLMAELMRETYGVMVYQEDVIKVAHYFAGLSLAEADVLRRGMSGKYRSRAEFDKIRQQYFQNCAEKGYSDAVSKEVWRQMESFSGYSFSKAHSASFAVESYQSLYLKTYFPLEFMVAVINNFGGFYKTEFYVHEARRYGGQIQAPDINESNYLTRLSGTTLWLGWVHVKGLEKQVIRDLMRSRKEDGPFASWDDFARRVPIGLEQAILLIRVGAFRHLNRNKKSLLWEAHARFMGKKPDRTALEMFEQDSWNLGQLPVLVHDSLEDAFDEWELLGFPLCNPFDLAAALPATTLNAQLVLNRGSILGYLVTLKPTRTKQGDRMYFGYFIDQFGEFFDTVHFPSDLQRYQFKGSGIYLMEGPVMEEHGHRTLRVQQMQKMAWRVDPRNE